MGSVALLVFFWDVTYCNVVRLLFYVCLQSIVLFGAAACLGQDCLEKEILDLHPTRPG